MQVILKEKIRNLGDIGDQVKVKPGFARNYLLPQDKAVPATAANMAELAKHRAKLEQHAVELLATAKSRAEALEGLKLEVRAKVSSEENLFGSVGVREIVNAIKETGHEVDKKEVILPEGPIHTLGEHIVNLQLHTDIKVKITVTVIEDIAE